jgi:hypothetical protein
MAMLPGRPYIRLSGFLVFCPLRRRETFVLRRVLSGLRMLYWPGGLNGFLVLDLSGWFGGLRRSDGFLVFCLSWRRETFVLLSSWRRKIVVLRGGLGACGLVGFGVFFPPGRIHGSSVRRGLPGRSGVVGPASIVIMVLLSGWLVSRSTIRWLSVSRISIGRALMGRALMGRAPVGRLGVLRLSVRWLSVGPSLGSRRIVIR